MSDTFTSIFSNGSKYSGQAPDSVEKLIEVLKNHTLDPNYEGNFAKNLGDCVSFMGNFFDLSHVFHIETNDPVLIERLTSAIRRNQETEKYEKCKKIRREQDEIQARNYRPVGAGSISKSGSQS